MSLLPVRLALLSLALLASSSGGCALFASAFDRPDPAGMGGARRYIGSECKAFELHDQTDTVDGRSITLFYSPQPSRIDPLPLRVAKVACGDMVASYPEDGGEPAYVQYHHDFDPRRFDHATAALILTMCNKDPSCLGPDEPNTTRRPATRHYPAGLLLDYAERVDPARVDGALAELAVSVELRKHFLGELEAARAQVRRIAAEITGAEAEVFIGIPTDVRNARAKQDAGFAELFARFDELATKAHAQREHGVDDASIAALEQLRADYLQKCGDLACLDRGLGVSLARALFFAHVSRQDALGAMAELHMAAPEQPIEIAREIDRLQEAAMQAASATHRKQTSLRDQGLDEGSAKAATGNAEAYDFSQLERWSFEGIRSVDWAQLVPGGGEPRHHGGKLAAKKASGNDVLLVFADEVERFADQACVDTNKVERIESDGRLIYGQRCRATGKTNVHRTKIGSVLVPTHEAKPLRVGDRVTAVVSGSEPMRGRVTSASRNDQLVQRRGLRMK